MEKTKLSSYLTGSPHFQISLAEKIGYLFLYSCILAQAWSLAQAMYQVWFLSYPLLNFWSLLWLGLTFARTILKPIIEYLSQKRALQLLPLLQNKVCEHYLYVSPHRLGQQDAAAFTTLVNEQIPSLQNYFSLYTPALWNLRWVPFVYTCVVIYLDWILGLILFITIPLIPLFMVVIGWGTESVQKKYAETLQRTSSLFSNRLFALPTLQRLNATEQQKKGLQERHAEWKDLTLKVLKIAFLSSAVLELFAALGVAMVAMIVGFRFLGFLPFIEQPLILTTGFFVLFLAPEVYLPFRQFAVLYHEKSQAEGVFETLQHWQPKEKNDTLIQSQTFAVEKAGLNFHAVQPDYTQIKLDLSLLPDDKVNLMGENGVGKSALLKSILGVHSYQGCIAFDALDIAQLSRRQRSELFFMLPANVNLLPLTIAENIALVRPDASRKEIEWAAEQAGVDRAFLNVNALEAALLPHFSLGQMQRIALARMWLSKASVILLDEPFSHQDQIIQPVLLDNILRFCQERCLILVSHQTLEHPSFTKEIQLVKECG